MKRKILAVLAALVLSAGVVVVVPGNTFAAVSIGGGTCGDPRVLGLRAWYNGICDGDSTDSNVASPSGDSASERKQALRKYVWTIVLNIVYDVSLVIGYIATAMVIYGGYMYIMAQGDPGKAAKGQKTLSSAAIGAVLAMGASVIVNTAKGVLGIADDGSWANKDASGYDILNDVFTYAYAMAGMVAVIFIIKSGVEYMVSRGDPGKMQKAIRGVIYAVAGLVITILAAAITHFVISSIGKAA